jgi:hypothetical protein
MAEVDEKLSRDGTFHLPSTAFPFGTFPAFSSIRAPFSLPHNCVVPAGVGARRAVICSCIGFDRLTRVCLRTVCCTAVRVAFACHRSSRGARRRFHARWSALCRSENARHRRGLPQSQVHQHRVSGDADPALCDGLPLLFPRRRRVPRVLQHCRLLLLALLLQRRSGRHLGYSVQVSNLYQVLCTPR